MKDYIINDKTLAILPYGSQNSVVYEHNNIYIVNRRPNKIISRNCIFNGSSYNGRVSGTKVLTGYSYKAPILINDKNLIFFPTSSPRLKNCSWISLNNLNDCYYDQDAGLSLIKFNNNTIIKLNISKYTLNSQILRATRLESKVRQLKINTF